MEMVITDQAIAKRVSQGLTYAFESEIEAIKMAQEIRSYVYPINCIDKHKREAIIFGVPK